MRKEFIGFIPTYNTEEFLRGTNFTSSGKHSYLGEDVIIDNSQLSPVIKYKYTDPRTNNISWVPIDGSDSPNRPAKMSDLDYILRKKDWTLGLGRKYVLKNNDGDDILCMFPSEKYPKDIISIDEFINKNKESIYIISDADYDETLKNTFLQNFNILTKDGDMNYSIEETGESINLGASYYNNLVSLHDIEKGSMVIDLLALGDSNYTNIINLSGIISQYEKSNAGMNNYLVNLGINYTIEGQVYSQEISLVPHEEDNEGKIKSKDLIINISDVVTLDYHNFCARVFSSVQEVSECILSYCYMIYEEKR